ncbi:MAG: hypothetical protein ACON4W_07745 [Parvibaculales bacterium]
MPWLKTIVSFTAGLLVFDILAATVSTQVVLNEIAALGVEISLQTRLSTTLHDILGLLPTFSPIFGLGFLIAFFTAAQLVKRTGLSADTMFAGAGFVSVLVTLVTIEAVFGLTALAAARELAGVVLLSLCGAPAGVVYLRLNTHLQAVKRPQP